MLCLRCKASLDTCNTEQTNDHPNQQVGGVPSRAGVVVLSLRRAISSQQNDIAGSAVGTLGSAWPHWTIAPTLLSHGSFGKVAPL